MTFYKLNIVPKAYEICMLFNQNVKPEVIPDHNDPFRVEWIDGDVTDDVLVGEKVGLAFCVVFDMVWALTDTHRPFELQIHTG